MTSVGATAYLLNQLDSNSNYTQDIEYDSSNHLKAFSIPKNKDRRRTIYILPELDAIEKN